MQTTATHFVVQDWYQTPEGKEVHSTLIDKKTGRRKNYGKIIILYTFFQFYYFGNRFIVLLY